MEIRLYIQMLRRGWWIVILTALVAVNVALLADFFATPMYQASTKFVLSPSNDTLAGRDVVTSLEALDKRSIVSTYAEFVNSRRIYVEALKVLQLQEIDMEDYTIQTVVLPDANILELTISGPDPQLAALLANTMAQGAINYISLIYRAYDISILDAAFPPVEPFSPQPVRDASLAMALGIIAGAAFAILSEQIRIPLESFRQQRQIDSLTGVFNKRYFRTFLEQELSKKPDDVHSIGIIELYGLRDVIDTLPQAASQRILLKTTDILRRELRGNDRIGRWTDTSFMVLLPSTLGADAGRIFDRIFTALLEPVTLGPYDDINIDLSPRIGGAVYSNNITHQELIEQANAALDQAGRDSTRSIYVWEMKNPFWVQ
jgi:diguanylate cyclase (GGDEF)-like protein